MGTLSENTKVSLGFLIGLAPGLIIFFNLFSKQEVQAIQITQGQIERVQLRKEQEDFRKEVSENLKTLVDNSNEFKTDLKVLKAKLGVKD